MGTVNVEDTSEAKSEKQVHKQLKMLDDSLKILAENVSRLGAELGSVLADFPADAKESEEKATQLMVPLANEIRKLRERCDQIRQNVESLLKRLEV